VLNRELRLLLVFFAVLALFAGVLLFVRSAHTDSSFSWTIKPPLTAAFLGASYWAACVLFTWSARQRLWVRARAALLPAFVIATFLLVATIVHFDRFHKDLFGYFWLTAYVVVPPLMILALARQLRAEPVEVPARLPLPWALRGVLLLQALVMAGVGVALYASPSSADSLWPWTLTPLTARAVGSFLIGFAAAAAQAVAENDVARLVGSALAYAVLGALELIAILRYTSELDGSGARGVIYVVFVATILAVGIWGLACMRRTESL
jgi:peptidoglycan/LPS O-acetylase OafA/YrhL